MQERGHLLPFPQAPDGVELRHLRAFVAVAEELNFSRAADRLYVSQPALSRQTRGLEQLVGCQLLRRSTHQVELTVVSTDFQDARDAFESLQAQLAPPAGTHVRPVTAGGVPSLMVSPAPDARPTVL
jgi:DNA-binding transcriptional LysR family regulator